MRIKFTSVPDLGSSGMRQEIFTYISEGANWEELLPNLVSIHILNSSLKDVAVTLKSQGWGVSILNSQGLPGAWSCSSFMACTERSGMCRYLDSHSWWGWWYTLQTCCCWHNTPIGHHRCILKKTKETTKTTVRNKSWGPLHKTFT